MYKEGFFTRFAREHPCFPLWLSIISLVASVLLPLLR